MLHGAYFFIQYSGMTQRKSYDSSDQLVQPKQFLSDFALLLTLLLKISIISPSSSWEMMVLKYLMWWGGLETAELAVHQTLKSNGWRFDGNGRAALVDTLGESSFMVAKAGGFLVARHPMAIVRQ
jgi:hypothetical protein